MTSETFTAIAREVLGPANRIDREPELIRKRWAVVFRNREFDILQQLYVDDQPDDDAGRRCVETQLAEGLANALANQRYD